MPSKDKRQIAIYVPNDYPFKGAEVKRELDDFFQWIFDTTSIFEKYKKASPSKGEKVMAILGGW
jgi:hypothetical protein